MKLASFVAGLVLVVSSPAMGKEDEGSGEGWLDKVLQATAKSQEQADGEADGDAYGLGYEFGANDAKELMRASRAHDEALDKLVGASLDELAAKTAQLLASESGSLVQREMEGLDDGLSTAGEPTSTAHLIGWNALMDLSPYWTARIEKDFKRPESGDQIGVGGTLYTIQNANKAHSLTTPERDVLRFEVLPGDNWEDDWSRYERSEIAGPVYPAGEVLTISYDLMVEPGEPIVSEWVVLAQFHADDNETPPPFAIELSREQMVVRARYRENGERKQIRLHRDTEPLERGRYYRMNIQIYFPDDEEDEGWVKVWRDGKPIVDYEGRIGYGYGNYWKVGVYRVQSEQTLAVKVRNLFVTGENGLIVLTRDDRLGAGPSRAD